MAIFYCQMSVVSRSSGRSAVAASAYRTAEKLTNERDGLVHDYSRRDGVEHSEIVLPEGMNAAWALERSALWNAAEAAEKRADARVAREFVIALPHELNAEKRLESTRDFAQDLANRYGAAVDFAIHAPHPEGDVRNHHAHVLMTTRQVTEEGFGAKTYLELANKELLPRDLPTTQMQLVDIRRSWEGMANERLAQEGLDVRIDHRSHAERGLEIEPTQHMGVASTSMMRRGGSVERGRIDEDAAKRNADLVREKPEQVLTLISNEKSVFDRHDIARALHRYINGDVQEFQNAFASVMASPALVELQAERTDVETGELTLARYSTREMVDVEHGMMASAERMHGAESHHVNRRHVEAAIGVQDAAIRRAVSFDTEAKVGRGEMSEAERQTRIDGAGLSDEQRKAIEHITGPEQIAAVVGFAGAGKSTMLAAARSAWEAQGYQVHGAALSGKAAEGLEESSGIESRTLASWERSWQLENRELGRGDVFVIDEAGMVGSRQLARFVGEAEQRGAKIVLVGDHEQLQAIGAGAPFRAIAEEIGHAELSDIRRQREGWQREASLAFATHKTAEGLAAYRGNGDIHVATDRDEARAEIVQDYLADREQRPEGTRVAMAHRRVDVRAINDGVRAELQERGQLAQGEESGELTFQTNDGQRSFAAGDRIVFLENNRDLGVKNGMLGTVDHVESGRIVATLDGRSDSISIPTNDYQAIDHGYATTIHKNQGATVDRAYVLASGTMDRHLTYVAMTRHRDSAQLYVDAQEFTDRKAGRLVEHGQAPFEHKEGNSQSYFVTLENAQGQRSTTWGVDLGRAMQEAAPEIGATIGLKHEGSQPVRLPDGTETHRNAWSVQDAGELAYAQLESRLSRSGAKETTLDYAKDFAERRGIAQQFGVRSEIELAPAQFQGQELSARAARPVQEQQDRPTERRHVYEERAGERAGPVSTQDAAQDLAHDAAKRDSQSRSAFEGLKLGRGSVADKSQQDRAEGKGMQAGQKGPEKADRQRRGMFDGLKLKPSVPTHRPEREGGERPSLGRKEAAQDRLAERSRPLSGFEQAVDGYARAFSAADKQLQQNLPVLEGQKQELHTAGQRLDQTRPGSHDLIRSALQYEPKTADAMTQLSGRDRVGQLVAGMDRERAALADPNVRAERFVQHWQKLDTERKTLTTGWHVEARQKVEGQMRDMAKSLERDPQLESALRNRGQDLGMGRNLQQNERVSQELQKGITRSRSQGLGLGL